MDKSSWHKTPFGTAETFRTHDEVFYSHSYTDKGRADVLAAAQDYITRNTAGSVQTVALKLLDEPEHDTYSRGTLDRWVLDTQPIIEKAKEIVDSLGLPW